MVMKKNLELWWYDLIVGWLKSRGKTPLQYNVGVPIAIIIIDRTAMGVEELCVN